jgi:hypothetical protein
MTYRPILFSAQMVGALLAGTKTQTRRGVKPQPSDYAEAHPGSYIDSYCGERKTTENPRGMSTRWMWWRPDNKIGPDVEKPCPYGVPGDRLWVRETFAVWDDGRHARREAQALGFPHQGVSFRADCVDATGRERDPDARNDFGVKWTPSIFMPRWASRLSLMVTSIRVERLQDITAEDARAEGVESIGATCDYRGAYCALWESINGAESWAANPWVWVVGFEVMR